MVAVWASVAAEASVEASEDVAVVVTNQVAIQAWAATQLVRLPKTKTERSTQVIEPR